MFWNGQSQKCLKFPQVVSNSQRQAGASQPQHCCGSGCQLPACAWQQVSPTGKTLSTLQALQRLAQHGMTHTNDCMWTKMRPLWLLHSPVQQTWFRRVSWRMCESDSHILAVFCGGLDGWAGCGFLSPLAPWFFPCLWCMPYEPSLAQVLRL